MKKNILIVEDEESIVDLIRNRLDGNIYNVDIALDGKEAIKKLALNKYDLVTLDIMLPYMDGLEICKILRRHSKRTIILMISALNTDDYKEKGYDCGIDDFIQKPFSAKELALKIKTSIKRRCELSSIDSEDTKYVSSFSFNDSSKKIFINGFEVGFTPSEYLILTTLLNNLKKVFSRSELAQLIYDNYLGDIDERGIDSHVYHIRKKVKKYEQKEMIKTIRGMGYAINNDED